MSCLRAFQDYGLRAIGIGEHLLPRGEGITLCEQLALIGSGMIWNLYFLVFAVVTGFFLAVAIALMRTSVLFWLSWPARAFTFIFRSSPLFLQFFFAYSALVLLPRVSIEFDLGFIELNAQTRWFTRAWLGAVLVLMFNTAAYSSEIFYGALLSVPKGDIEAAKAFGMDARQCFWRVAWPVMLRLSWPAYTNEVIFLFHATTLVYLSSFPARSRQGDALFYAQYFAEQTFNPFIAYPIVAGYFILVTLAIIGISILLERQFNRGTGNSSSRFKFRPRYLR